MATESSVHDKPACLVICVETIILMNGAVSFAAFCEQNAIMK